MDYPAHAFPIEERRFEKMQYLQWLKSRKEGEDSIVEESADAVMQACSVSQVVLAR